MTGWTFIDRDRVRLGLLDFGGEGFPVLLLHGLAGHAGEWAQTAGWLRGAHHPWALDQRGHGRSERRPAEVGAASLVADALAVIEELGRRPVTLVGQSLGGRTAMVAASRRPDLVRALIVAEASPAASSRQSVQEVVDRLTSWPVPFSTPAEAIEYFGGPSPSAEAWTGSLEEREGGWWPAFDLGTLARYLQESTAEALWPEWESIRCPTLVVRGERGILARADAEEMVSRLPRAKLVEVARAGHDVHLDRPARWREVVSRFLLEVEGPTTRRKPR